ncbi:uncharacterized protein LOC134177287 [Corticium candelabrum]|uniref:uncharacterized protein LOC134177287 n=1 Tax=Corticium candelabrum TaxID=121492 RepID=UPI002E253CD0|nr:uncharacterized protein LOC134177287 [Corticium candelabrum]
MIVLQIVICFALRLLYMSSSQTLNLYENVTLSGGWTVYPINFIVVENTSVTLLCKRNDTFTPAYQVRSFDGNIFGNVLLKFQNDLLVTIELGTLKLKIDRFSKKYEGVWQCTATVTSWSLQLVLPSVSLLLLIPTCWIP